MASTRARATSAAQTAARALSAFAPAVAATAAAVSADAAALSAVEDALSRDAAALSAEAEPLGKDPATIWALTKCLHGIILCKKGMGNGYRGLKDSGVNNA